MKNGIFSLVEIITLTALTVILSAIVTVVISLYSYWMNESFVLGAIYFLIAYQVYSYALKLMNWTKKKLRDFSK